MVILISSKKGGVLLRVSKEFADKINQIKVNMNIKSYRIVTDKIAKQMEISNIQKLIMLEELNKKKGKRRKFPR